MSKTRTRVESQFRGTVSKDGSYSPHIPKEVAQPLIEYCRKHNMPKNDFVCEAINTYLDFLKRGENSHVFNLKNSLAERLFNYCEITYQNPSDIMDEILTKFFEQDSIKAKELDASVQTMMSRMSDATKNQIVYDHCMKTIKAQGLVGELEV